MQTEAVFASDFPSMLMIILGGLSYFFLGPTLMLIELFDNDAGIAEAQPGIKIPIAENDSV